MYKRLSGVVFLLTLCLTGSLHQACNKKQEEQLTEPKVLLTPGSLEGKPSQTVTTNYTITSFNSMNRLQVVENYKGASRSLMDTAFNPALPALDKQFLYQIPDSAKAGDKIDLLFTAVDTKGLSTSQNLDIRVVQ